MEYSKLTKETRKQWLETQIADLERQHFEQEQFAAAAEAAADVPEPDDGDESTEAAMARQMRSYVTTAAQHRASVLEAERRIAAFRAALSALEVERRPKGPRTAE